MEGRHLPPSPSRYFFFFLAAFFFFAIRKSPPFRCNRPTQPSPRRSPRLRLVGTVSTRTSNIRRRLAPAPLLRGLLALRRALLLRFLLHGSVTSLPRL